MKLLKASLGRKSPEQLRDLVQTELPSGVLIGPYWDNGLGQRDDVHGARPFLRRHRSRSSSISTISWFECATM